MSNVPALRKATASALGWTCLCQDPSGQTNELFGSRTYLSISGDSKIVFDRGYQRVPHYEEGEALLEVASMLGQVEVFEIPLPLEYVYVVFLKEDKTWNAIGTSPAQAACKLLVYMAGTEHR
jgi:hypothetical protein